MADTVQVNDRQVAAYDGEALLGWAISPSVGPDAGRWFFAAAARGSNRMRDTGPCPTWQEAIAAAER